MLVFLFVKGITAQALLTLTVLPALSISFPDVSRKIEILHFYRCYWQHQRELAGPKYFHDIETAVSVCLHCQGRI